MSEPFIILIGLTGAGKSTFLNNCNPAQKKAKVGKNLSSCTRSLTPYKCSSPKFGTFVVVDTPGFDDSGGLSDQDIVQKIVEYVEKTYKKSNVKCGVILLRDGGAPDTYQSGRKIVNHLQNAFPGLRGAIKTIHTTHSSDDTEYNGRAYPNTEANTFCMGKVESILGIGLRVNDLLLPLRKIKVSTKRAEVPGPGPIKWWDKVRRMFS